MSHGALQRYSFAFSEVSRPVLRDGSHFSKWLRRAGRSCAARVLALRRVLSVVGVACCTVCLFVACLLVLPSRVIVSEKTRRNVLAQTKEGWLALDIS